MTDKPITAEQLIGDYLSKKSLLEVFLLKERYLLRAVHALEAIACKLDSSFSPQREDAEQDAGREARNREVRHNKMLNDFEHNDCHRRGVKHPNDPPNRGILG